MDGSLLTKCPQCKTLFRVKFEHLAVADGEVRCGICFKVFNAQSEGLSYSQEVPKGETAAAKSVLQSSEGIGDGLRSDTKIDLPGDSMPLEDESALPKEIELASVVIENESPESRLFETPDLVFERPAQWSILSVCAIILLSAQWLWFKKEEYALTAFWRPFYQSSCNILNCTMPAEKDLSQFESERLVVKTHPEFDNVLIIDMLINNRAGFPQPLPGLVLEFYDLNDAVVAAREFKPPEYMNDISRPRSYIPANTPMRISFSILDPGNEAANYAVQFTNI